MMRHGDKGGGRDGAILMYHRIERVSTGRSRAAVTADDLHAQLACLRRDFHPIALEDLVGAARGGQVPDGAVALTFDDGYLDALEIVSPLLREFGIPATFFVTTGDLDERSEFWWDALERILGPASSPPAALEIDLDGRRVVFSTVTKPERARAYASLKDHMIAMSREDRDRTLEDLVDWSGATVAPQASGRLLRSEEIVRLARCPGHAIGAHGVNHLFLSSQPLGVRLQEIVDSKASLERLLGRPVHLFAYPYGGFDAETVEMVQAAGFMGAVTTIEGPVRPGADAFRLPRCEITGGDPQDFDRALRELRVET